MPTQLPNRRTYQQKLRLPEDCMGKFHSCANDMQYTCQSLVGYLRVHGRSHAIGSLTLLSAAWCCQLSRPLKACLRIQPSARQREDLQVCSGQQGHAAQDLQDAADRRVLGTRGLPASLRRPTGAYAAQDLQDAADRRVLGTRGLPASLRRATGPCGLGAGCGGLQSTWDPQESFFCEWASAQTIEVLTQGQPSIAGAS